MNRPKKWKMIEVEDSLSIPFEYMDKTPGGQNLGRAEFQVCIKFKRGQVSEFWVYPRQQRREDCWHYSGGSDLGFSISSYEGLDNSHVWLVSYCREHKTQTFMTYAPNGAKFLKIDSYGIHFCKTK